MKKLCEPVNEAELIVIKSLLDSEGVDYFVQGDNFGSLEVGPRIGHYNAKTVMVPDDQYAWAVEVLGSQIRENRSKGAGPEHHYSLWDKIRMILECALIGWFMPGRMRRKRKKERPRKVSSK